MAEFTKHLKTYIILMSLYIKIKKKIKMYTEHALENTNVK